MSAEIHLTDGGAIKILAPYPTGTVRIELHTDDGDMAACDFSKENLCLVIVALQSLT